MKSLHVLRTLNPEFGGPVSGTASLVKELARLGHSTHVATLDSPGTAWEQQFPVPVLAFGPAHGSYGYAPRFPKWLRQSAAEYDAVVVNGVFLYPSLGVWHGLRNTNTPYFLYTHGALHPWFAKAYPQKHIKKTIYWKLWEHRTVQDARAVLFTAAEEQNMAMQSFSPFYCRAATVSYCAASPPPQAKEEAARFLQRFPELQGHRFALFLGRIHPVKGCDLLIAAFARVASRFPEIRLVIAGFGSPAFTEILKMQAASQGVADRITWTGALSEKEKWGALMAADLFISCSHCENFCVAAAEALACGTPVATTNQVSISREIQEYGAGFAAEDSLGGATELLEKWLAFPESDWQQFQDRARHCYEEKYRVQKTAQRLLEMFHNSGVAV